MSNGNDLWFLLPAGAALRRGARGGLRTALQFAAFRGFSEG